MSLKKCRECGEMVSTTAKTCPHCGAKVKKPATPLILLAVAVVIIAASIVALKFVDTAKSIRETGEAAAPPFAAQKLIVERTIREGLAERYGVQCVSTNLFEGTDGHFAGTAKLDDGRELDVDGTIEGDMVRYSHIVKEGYEYKCKHHIDQVTLTPPEQPSSLWHLSGKVWNDEARPIRGFFVVQLLDERGRIQLETREIVGFESLLSDPFPWIRPGESCDFDTPLNVEEGVFKNMHSFRIEFFNLGNEAPVSIALFKETGDVKVTAKMHYIGENGTLKPQQAQYAMVYLGSTATDYQQGEYDVDIAKANDALETDPNNGMAYNDRGLAYHNKHLYEQAISDFNKAVKIDPRSAIIYHNRGAAYYHKGRYVEAISDFKKALEINPRFVEAYYGRGLAYGVQARHDQAISDFTSALIVDFRTFQRWNSLPNKGLTATWN